jgi:FtsP/CotA-like multicopper oxidase with cupredoxin domain
VKNHIRRPMSRRLFLRSVGIAAGGTVVGLSALEAIQRLSPPAARLVAATGPIRPWTLAFTDGFVSMPTQAASIDPFWPDVGAPSPFNLYVFGIRDLQFINDNPAIANKEAAILAHRGQAQISGPLLWADVGDDVRLDLWNLGLAKRPDLTDSHTLHWHGFPNQIAYFDGVPDASLAAPIGRKLSYQYIPEDPGTYMYHCHVEDVEHVHMGLTGLVFVRPNSAQQAGLLPHLPAGVPSSNVKFAYNLPTTYYHREFSIFISEVNVHAHWNDRHAQDTDWTDYNADFSLFNGRAWPDTVLPHGNARSAAAGRLQYNPISSLIQGAAGERVLVRIANLGFQEHSLVLPGLPMTVIGRDAKPQVAGRPAYDANEVGSTAPNRADISNITNRIDIGPGESRDVVFDVPGTLNLGLGQSYQSYPFYDREYGFVKTASSASGDGYGGMRTEVRLHQSLPAQSYPGQLV